MPYPYSDALAQIFANTPGYGDVQAAAGPATLALHNLALQQKGLIGMRAARTGTGRFGQTGVQMAGVDRNEMTANSDMLLRLMAQKSAQMRQDKLLQDELDRQKKTKEEGEQRGKEMGTANLIGAGVGGLAGLFLGGPVGAGLGAKAGGELSSSLYGTRYGYQPSYGGLENIAGYMQGQEKSNADEDLLRELYGLPPRGAKKQLSLPAGPQISGEFYNA